MATGSGDTYWTKIDMHQLDVLDTSDDTSVLTINCNGDLNIGNLGPNDHESIAVRVANLYQGEVPGDEKEYPFNFSVNLPDLTLTDPTTARLYDFVNGTGQFTAANYDTADPGGRMQAYKMKVSVGDGLADSFSADSEVVLGVCVITGSIDTSGDTVVLNVEGVCRTKPTITNPS